MASPQIFLTNSSSLRKNSTFRKELIAVYLAVKLFQHHLEARKFTLLTDHKPFIYALRSSSDKHLPKEARHMNLILQHTTDVQYLADKDNIVADILFRTTLSTISLSDIINLENLATSWEAVEQLQKFLSNPNLMSLKLKKYHYLKASNCLSVTSIQIFLDPMSHKIFVVHF